MDASLYKEISEDELTEKAVQDVVNAINSMSFLDKESMEELKDSVIDIIDDALIEHTFGYTPI